MKESIAKRFSKRDKEASGIRNLAEQEGLEYLSTSEDTENFTKSLLFSYRGIMVEISVRFSSMRYPVLVVGKPGELLFENIPHNLSKTSEGIRIGVKGKSYPKTQEHVIDQVRLFKLEIDKRVENSTLNLI